MKQRIKINGVVIIIVLIIMVFLPYWFIRHFSSPDDEILEIIGVVLILLGQLLRVSARGHKVENSLNGNRLIQDGPYSMVRNPMYLGIILIGLGVVFFVLELWVAIIFAGLFILRYRQLFVKEEKILFEAFGSEYTAYKKNVPRLFPRLSFICKKEIHTYLPLKLAWFKRESLSIIIVLGACLLIEFWEETKFNNWNAVTSEAFILLLEIILYFIFILFLIKHDKSYETFMPAKSQRQ